MIVKIVLVVLVLMVVYLVFWKYDVSIEKFINYLPISQTIKCFNNNENLISFTDDMNSIFDKYKIETGELELSTKFRDESVNANRLVAFIPCTYVNENPDLLNDCFKINKIPEELQETLEEKIDENNPSKTQVLFGIDLDEMSRRVYLNYVKKNKIHLVGFNIEKESIAKKIYTEMKKEEFKKELRNLIYDELTYELILRIFPEETWKIIGAKEDENVKKYKYSSFYINMLYEYKVNYYNDRLKELLKKIYKGNPTLIDKWYDCFKKNNITWISIGRDRDDKLFLTIYCVYTRERRAFVDKEKIALFNKELKKIKSLL